MQGDDDVGFHEEGEKGWEDESEGAVEIEEAEGIVGVVNCASDEGEEG